MKIGKRDIREKVFVIAEIGNNHEGDIALATEMIGLAADAGADAVKFQTIVPEKLVSPSERDRIARLKKFQLSYEQFTELKHTAEIQGVEFMSTPFDLESAAFLNDLVPAFKIASGDLTFQPLLETVAGMGKPILLSAGASTIEETKAAVGVLKRAWKGRSPIEEALVLLHCVVSYPTKPEEANLRAIQALSQLGLMVGYSDHTIGITAPLAAVGLGARVIEKHFTIDKQYSDFRDHQLSADRKELKELVTRIRELDLMLGSGTKEIQPSEEQNRTAVRRAIAAARPLRKGEVLTAADLTWVRPATGLAPGEEHRLIGKKLRHEIQDGAPIKIEDVE